VAVNRRGMKNKTNIAAICARFLKFCAASESGLPQPSGQWLFLFDVPQAEYYFFCMTKTEVITFRSPHSKRELRKRFGNVSKGLNNLIQREIGGQQTRDWREILDRPAPKVSKKVFDRCMMPE
jgi:hypothetical protein